MEIIIAKTAGFCFGVNKAVSTVTELANKKDKQIYTLGSIIHNDQVVNQLKKSGVKVIDTVDQADISGKIVIRAHGVSPNVYEKLENSGHEIIDATCPYVKKIHRLVADKFKEGYKVIIVGDKNHPEVIGINGWCNDRAIIINDEGEANSLPAQKGKACIVAQTTITRAKWEGVIKALSSKFEEIDTFDTICNATSSRQLEAEQIASQVDMMLVLGSNSSSNTQKLYEICKKYCKNTYLIETFGELPPVDYKKINKIGITAGASTPEWVIEEVTLKMSELNKMEQEMSFEEALNNSMVSIQSGEIVEGTIIGILGNEVYVDLGGKYEGVINIEEFTEDPDFNTASIKKGQLIKVYVARVNDAEGTVVLSKKKVDAIEGWEKIAAAKENGMEVKVKVTDVVKGGVVATAYGVRVFIPASQISNRFVQDLNEYLKQVFTVNIIEVDRQKRKVVASRKAIVEREKNAVMDKFWEDVQIGKTFKGTVKSLTDFGAFVDIGGVDGLIHISELSWNKIKHPSQVVKVGDAVEVYILEFDRAKNRISLGFKKAEENPWFNAEEKYAVGNIVKGKVARIVPFGAFVELAPGVDGLVHISQISNARLAKPSDVLEIGQVVEAKVIEFKLEDKKIGLSIKEVSPIDPVKADEATVTEDGEVLPTEHVEEMENKIEIPTDLLEK